MSNNSTKHTNQPHLTLQIFSSYIICIISKYKDLKPYKRTQEPLVDCAIEKYNMMMSENGMSNNKLVRG